MNTPLFINGFIIVPFTHKAWVINQDPCSVECRWTTPWNHRASWLLSLVFSRGRSEYTARQPLGHGCSIGINQHDATQRSPRCQPIASSSNAAHINIHQYSMLLSLEYNIWSIAPHLLRCWLLVVWLGFVCWFYSIYVTNAMMLAISSNAACQLLVFGDISLFFSIQWFAMWLITPHQLR